MTDLELQQRLRGLRAVVVGGLNADHFLVADGTPVDDGCVRVRSRLHAFGGHAGNAAAALARLGVGSVAVLGAVGDDAAGDALLRDLVECGVRDELVQRVGRVPTGEVTVLQLGSMRCMLMDRGANEHLRIEPGTAAADELAGADLVIVFDPPREALAVVRSTARSGLTLWNPGGFYPASDDFVDLCRGMDVVVLNRVEFDAAFAGRRPNAVPDAHDRPALFIETRGAQGCAVFAGGAVEHYLAAAVDAVDETGAGDAFSAAFAAFHAVQLPRAEVVAWASSVAALSTLRRGARAGLPTLDEASLLRSRSFSNPGACRGL